MIIRLNVVVIRVAFYDPGDPSHVFHGSAFGILDDVNDVFWVLTTDTGHLLKVVFKISECVSFDFT